MTIYVANSNGDWWEIKPEGAQECLFVLNTDDLTKADWVALSHDGWDTCHLGGEDKLEEVIWKYGKSVPIDVPVTKVIDPTEFTYEFITGMTVHVVATSLEEAERMLAHGIYEEHEVVTELRHVGNA